MSSDDIPAAPHAMYFRPDAVTLYGVQLNGLGDDDPAYLRFHDDLVLTLAVKTKPAKGPETSVPGAKAKIAVIYGYAFEGHCYRFDRPRIVLFDDARVGQPADGCGFGTDYTMWTVDALDRVMELTTRNGLVEDIILESNLPGRRAPNTYGDHMQLAHRNGRLQRD